MKLTVNVPLPLFTVNPALPLPPWNVPLALETVAVVAEELKRAKGVLEETPKACIERSTPLHEDGIFETVTDFK